MNIIKIGRFFSSLLLALVLIQSFGCITIDNQFGSIAPGLWRGVLQLEASTVSPNQKGEYREDKLNMKFEDATNGELPFQFEIKYVTDSTFGMDIINGTERIAIPAKDIRVKHSRQTGQDSIIIKFPEYNTYIWAIYKSTIMEGEWVVPDKKVSIPFLARFGQAHRFTSLAKKPTGNISGKWDAQLGLSDSVPEHAIGEFSQKGNDLQGTFRTETGDYRYLAGEVQANKIYLSCFDGAHAYLFEAKLRNDTSITGTIRSGKTYSNTWQAHRDGGARLRNPDSLTFMKAGSDKLAFSFVNPEGKVVSLANPEYQGKIKVIQIMGTWCPNCKDEAVFLMDYMKNHPNNPVSAIALSFERSTDVAVANKQISTYKEKMNLPYQIVYAGKANTSAASAALPMLNRVMAFPTMIVLDKNDKVRLIHTGFDGPATSEYLNFKKEFEDLMEKIK
jgi:thiol-disulfide isomerase/thioredoxin